MNDTEKNTTRQSVSVTDYAREIEEMIAAERERTSRILRIIDDSMTAIHKTKKLTRTY